MNGLFENFGAAAIGGSCNLAQGVSSFLGIPHWYEYLPGVWIAPDAGNKVLVCNPQLTNINDVWLIAAAIIEILIRIAALAAIAFVMYGGVTYMTSQGEPDKTVKARQTIIGALAGLALAVLAAAIVAFIAGSVN